MGHPVHLIVFMGHCINCSLYCLYRWNTIFTLLFMWDTVFTLLIIGDTLLIFQFNLLPSSLYFLFGTHYWCFNSFWHPVHFIPYFGHPVHFILIWDTLFTSVQSSLITRWYNVCLFFRIHFVLTGISSLNCLISYFPSVTQIKLEVLIIQLS